MSILGGLLAFVALLQGSLLLFAYLNNQVFPQPLTEEEEREQLALLKQGSEDARNILIEHNLRGSSCCPKYKTAKTWKI